MHVTRIARVYSIKRIRDPLSGGKKTPLDHSGYRLCPCSVPKGTLKTDTLRLVLEIQRLLSTSSGPGSEREAIGTCFFAFQLPLVRIVLSLPAVQELVRSTIRHILEIPTEHGRASSQVLAHLIRDNNFCAYVKLLRGSTANALIGRLQWVCFTTRFECSKPAF